LAASISSARYSALKLGKAIATNINAGSIVQISSITVPWFKLRMAIRLFFPINKLMPKATTKVSSIISQ